MGDSIQVQDASLDKLLQILDVFLKAFPHDPGCLYKFPGYEEHPEDFKNDASKMIEEYLKSERYICGIVVNKNGEVIGMVIIDKSPLVISTIKCFDENGKYADPSGMKSYESTMKELFQTNFQVLGDDQYHLSWVMVDPDYWRIGCGRKICDWTFSKAKIGGRDHLTVMASPKGKLLYEAMKFELVDEETAESYNKKVEIFALKWKWKG